MVKKLVIDLRGPDGNVFAVIGKVCSRLKEMGEDDLAKQLKKQAFEQHSYEDVLKLCQTYTNVEYIR